MIIVVEDICGDEDDEYIFQRIYSGLTVSSIDQW